MRDKAIIFKDHEGRYRLQIGETPILDSVTLRGVMKYYFCQDYKSSLVMDDTCIAELSELLIKDGI